MAFEGPASTERHEGHHIFQAPLIGEHTREIARTRRPRRVPQIHANISPLATLEPSQASRTHAASARARLRARSQPRETEIQIGVRDSAVDVHDRAGDEGAGR